MSIISPSPVFLNNLIELMHLLGIELFEVEDNKMLYDTIFEFKNV